MSRVEHSPPVPCDLEFAEELFVQMRGASTVEAHDALCAEIVSLTLELADSAARRYWYRGIDSGDLTQVARLGLMKAIRAYDPDFGSGFAAYAMPTITGELKRHFRDQGWLVRPPRSLQELRVRVAAEEEVLRARLRRDPTEAELADTLEVDPKTVAATKVAARGFAAESLTPDEQGHCPVEPVAEGDPYREVDEWESVRQALHSLSPRQRLVLRLRYVDDLTQAEIGAQVGVSQMQISRILTKCMTQLRAQVEAA